MSAVMYAFMVIFNKKAVSIAGLENATGQLMTSFITVAIFLGLRLGLVNTGLGCYFYFSSIGDLPVQTVAMWGYLEPLSALAFSAAFLGEKLGGVQVVGAILILGGAAFGELFHPQ
jgi:drug/metabolite transporter (DMT)-like permease